MRFILFILPLALFACGDEKPQMELNDPTWTKDNSSDMHQVFAEEEDEEIDFFLETHKDWKMTKTGTGLRYFVYQKSEEVDSAKVGDVVRVDFEISLLDGTLCYTSEENGPEEFMVEKTDIESGLHEGVKFMCAGDRAKFILPSHMAHGLIGDEEKIPPLTPVIYDIQLLAILKP